MWDVGCGMWDVGEEEKRLHTRFANTIIANNR